MRIYNKDLKRARRWLAAGQTTRVIRFLEPKVPLFLEDPDYYALLGRACLEAGLIKDAETYLICGIQANPHHLDVRQVLAVNHLKRKDPSSAVRTWLELMEDFPDDPLASRGLKALKKISDQNAQDRFLESFDPRRFLPDVSMKWPSRILAVLTIVLATIMLLYFRDTIGPMVQKIFSSSPRRIVETSLSIPSSLFSEEDRPLAFHYTNESQMNRTMKNALNYFESYEDNSARFELNKIIYSNAAEELRQKAKLLLQNLKASEMGSLETAFTYEEVSKNPWIYEGCWVLWKGATANVAFFEDAINFDFLVGFHDARILKGPVAVHVPFLAVIEPLPLELLAKVVPSDTGFSLEAKTMHFVRE